MFQIAPEVPQDFRKYYKYLRKCYFVLQSNTDVSRSYAKCYEVLQRDTNVFRKVLQELQVAPELLQGVAMC